MAAARRGSVPGLVSSAKVGVRRDALRRVARADPVSVRLHVSGMQRARLLGAAVATVEDQGWSGATVARVTRRARVSRRTFYELFANREDCLVAMLEDIVGGVRGELARAGLEGLSWHERVRGGLLVILSFFDREPVLARVCVVRSLHGGQGVLERREALLRALAEVVDEGRLEGPRGAVQSCPSLMAEGLVGAAFAIVYARLLRGEHEPLTGLLGELMGMIVLPYLGPAAARREQHQNGTAPISLASGGDGQGGLRSTPGLVDLTRDPLAEVPMRLTYRTARVLEVVGEFPGISNRLVATHAGITDQGQVSKLLARLERLGLLTNTGAGHTKGERNQWHLTPLGVRVTQSLRTDTHGRTIR